MKDMIHPNYAQAEVKDVYSHATYVEILNTKSLALMSMVRHKTITKDLPSWAVDFIYPQELKNMDIPIFMEVFLDMFGKAGHPWTQATPKIDADVEYNKQDALLTIKGLEFDQILTAFPVVNPKSKELPSPTSWRRLTLATIPWTSKLVLDKRERKFCRQVLLPLESQTAYQRLTNGDDAYLSPPEYETNGMRRILVETIMVDWLFHKAHDDTKCIDNELGEDDASSYHISLDSYFDHLSGEFESRGASTAFFITRKGFVGVGPRDMRSGDQIILPYGSRHPMLIRSEPEGFSTFLSFVQVA